MIVNDPCLRKSGSQPCRIPDGPTRILMKFSPITLQIDWLGMVKLVFPLYQILLDFWPIQNLMSKPPVFIFTLKYIVKQANFEHVVRNLRRMVWKTDHGTSSGMLWTFRNQCHFDGTFPYISAVTTFEIHFLSFLRAKSSRVGELKIIISHLLVSLF